MYAWQCFIIVASLIASALVGSQISMSEQWKLIEALMGSGEVLFGIIGIWLSLVYPDVLRNLHAAKQLSEVGLEKSKFLKLIFPAIVSVLSIVLILLLKWLDPVCRVFPWLVQNKLPLRMITFFLISLISLEQITAFILAMIPLGRMESDTKHLAEIKHDEIERNKLTQKS